MISRILLTGGWLLVPLMCALSCISNEGVEVDWWVVLKVPGKVNQTGFGYYDSRMSTNKLTVYPNAADQQRTALWRTLQQINSMSLQTLAWNDESPNGTVSSDLAHSKTVIAVLQSEKNGFMLVHSIPKYPAFIGNVVNQTIGASELIYGQHALCMTIAVKTLDLIASKVMITHPDIYHSTITNWLPNLYTLSQQKFGNSTDNFDNLVIVLGSITSVRTIYKNNDINCSIFQDGLNNYLKSKMVAETWGRPLQPAWCVSPYPVTNVINITLGNYTWTQTDDHSKWAIADKNYSCFGDMNRMTSQWGRGGSFYCLNSDPLLAAMKAIVTGVDQCGKIRL